MIGLLMIIAVARWFAKLAFDYDKNRWLYGFLGVATYYAGFFVVTILFDNVDASTIHPIVQIVLIIGLSYGMVAVLYDSLRSVWKKNFVVGNHFPEGEAELLDSYTSSTKDF